MEVDLNIQKKTVRKRFESEKMGKRGMWLKSKVVFALGKKGDIAPLGHFPILLLTYYASTEFLHTENISSLLSR